MSKFTRKHRDLPYRRRLVFLTEGAKTEESYLRVAERLLGLRESCDLVFPYHDTDIAQLVAQAGRQEKEPGFRPSLGDELWIILDRDEECHFPQHFSMLDAWEQAAGHRHAAISNPRFEYWLLLHVLPRPSKAQAISDSFVEKHIPRFKNLPIGTTSITRARIQEATERANRGNIPTPANPDHPGTAMGRLMAHLPARTGQ